MARQTEMERKCVWCPRKGFRHGVSRVVSTRTSGVTTTASESQAGPQAWVPRMHRIKKLREAASWGVGAQHARPTAKSTTAW